MPVLPGQQISVGARAHSTVDIPVSSDAQRAVPARDRARGHNRVRERDSRRPWAPEDRWPACVVVHRGDPGALAAGPAGAGRIWLVIMPQHSGDEGPQHAVLAPAPGQAGRSDRPRRDTARRAQRPQDQAPGTPATGPARAAPQRRREDAARARAHDQADLAGRERQAVLDRREHNPPSRPHPEFRPRQGPGPPMLPEPASPPHPAQLRPVSTPCALLATCHLVPAVNTALLATRRLSYHTTAGPP